MKPIRYIRITLMMSLALALAGCGGDDEEVAPIAKFVSVSHKVCIPENGTITVTFDNPPRDVTVNYGNVTVAGKKATISGIFRAGPIELEIRWADGTQVLYYTNIDC